MNVINLIGNLTKDNERRFLSNGTEVFNNNIAVTKNFKNKEGEYETDFISTTAFGKTAEILNAHTKKGDKVLLTGRLEPQTYEKDNVTHYSYKVIVNSFEFLQTKPKEININVKENDSTSISDDVLIDMDNLPY